MSSSISNAVIFYTGLTQRREAEKGGMGDCYAPHRMHQDQETAAASKAAKVPPDSAFRPGATANQHKDLLHSKFSTNSITKTNNGNNSTTTITKAATTIASTKNSNSNSKTNNFNGHHHHDSSRNHSDRNHSDRNPGPFVSPKLSEKMGKEKQIKAPRPGRRGSLLQRWI